MRMSTCLIALVLASPASAGDNWSIDWYSIDGGGTMEAVSGNWELKGSIGQADATAANEITSSQWQLTGGFWALVAEFSTVIFRDGFEAPPSKSAKQTSGGDDG